MEQIGHDSSAETREARLSNASTGKTAYTYEKERT